MPNKPNVLTKYSISATEPIVVVKHLGTDFVLAPKLAVKIIIFIRYHSMT